MRVNLSGYVCSDSDQEVYDWWGIRAFSPAMIRDAIANNPTGEELVFEINSGGGSVFAGSEMYTVLRSAEGVRTRAEIQSLAASAASYLCLGCDEVLISPVAQMMIHLPSTWTEGNRNDHLESLQMLDSTREAIINAYELKAGDKADRAEFRRMMNASTWMTAQMAVEKGLADGIMFQDTVVPENVMNAVGSGIRALGEAGGMPDIVQMRAEYRRHKQAEPGGAPAANNWSWQAEARLALEKIRF